MTGEEVKFIPGFLFKVFQFHVDDALTGQHPFVLQEDWMRLGGYENSLTWRNGFCSRQCREAMPKCSPVAGGQGPMTAD